jgi:DNA primase catalytic core
VTAGPVHAISGNGDLEVQHLRNRHRVRLPAAYVQTSAELGYATTVHGAQGLSVDTMHGLATGEESRQQLYTMLTRGRVANHLYLQVVGDGDPHSIVWPETVRPATATDLLEQILARDDAARSATTLLSDQHDPAARLADAAERYVDALHVAAEDLAGPEVVAALEKAAEQAVPGLAEEPAWPTLRARLLLLSAAGIDPVAQLLSVVDTRELDTAVDRAAVLGWRLDATGYPGPGPLPWLPAIPQHLQAHQMWGSYLTARAATVTDLAERIRASANADQRPTWAGPGSGQPPFHVIKHVEVWRAATGVSPDDRRPTGPVQRHKAARIWQRHLDQALADGVAPAWPEWRPLVEELAPNISQDSFAPILAGRLAAISRAGVDATQLLRAAVLEKPLPDDHAAAALWWRIYRHHNPAQSAQINRPPVPTVPWEPRLAELIGTSNAQLIQTSPWWPALVTAVDQALQRGWRLEDLISAPDSGPTPTNADQCQALLWRISVALDRVLAGERDQPHPSLVSDDAAIAGDPPTTESALAAPADGASTAGPAVAMPADPADNERYLEADLAVAAMLRDVAGPPEQTDADVTRMFTRAMAWRECPVSQNRMVEVNQLSLAYFRRHFLSSWAQQYLADRFGQDITDDHRFLPGQAPAGWTSLVDHLRRLGITDEEMLITGVAATASTGRLIDRFRDRVVFPIIDDGKVLGFVGRRRPDLTDVDRTGPKYLNTGDTPLFHKGAQLFGAPDDQISVGAIPVIVEGPMDAIAVTLATCGRYIGVAPLGTSLTDEQAHQLARIGRQPIVATDADLAGRIAAERDFWMLSCHRLDPLHARIPAGTDPADLLALGGPGALTEALTASQPLAERLSAERMANLPPADAVLEATRIVAARPSHHWEQGSSAISAQLGVPIAQVRCSLFTLVKEWNTDPRRAAQQPLQAIGDVKRRIAAAIEGPAGQPRTAPARGLDRRLHQNPKPAGGTRRTKPEGRRVPPSSRTGTPRTPAR